MNSNPFVGPSPLGFGQKIYGRDREIRELFYLLAAERIAWLHSPSGAGKTSLVQSGLIPRLLQDEFAVLPSIRVSWQPPTELPLANRYALSMLVSLEEHRDDTHRLPIEKLAELSMQDYLEIIEQNKDDEKCPVLLFDQFEEVLTLDPLGHSARLAFFEELADLLENRRLWALFSLREDYLAPLASYAEVLPTRMNHLFRLDLLGTAAARQAIVETARDGGRHFEEDAAKKLVGDLTGLDALPDSGLPEDEAARYVEPVQLQVVCRSLWERVDADQQRIGPQDLQKIGNVDQALQDYYAERIAQVALDTAVDERQLRDWFDRQLITEAGLRGQVLRGEESSGGLPDRGISPSVDAHLIRTERRRGLVWIELAHDRLVAPVRSDNARWRQENLSLLALSTEAWEQAGRPANNPRLLLLGEELAATEQWLEGPENGATEDEALYLETCRAVQVAEDARQRQARRERWLWKLSAVACLVIAALCYATWQDKLKSRREAALGKQGAAEVAFREANYEESWRKTLEALEETDKRLPESLGRLLLPELQPSSVRPADLIRKGLKLPKGEQLHGLWLDRSGKSQVFTVSSRHVIEKYFYRLRWLDLRAPKPSQQKLPISLDEARSFAWDAQRQRLAVGDWRAKVTLLQWREMGWKELWTETLSGSEECEENCDVLSLRFDASGRQLAAGGIGKAFKWNLRADGSRVEARGQPVWDAADSERSIRVLSLAFHPTEHRLAVGLEDGRVLIRSGSGDVTPAQDFGIGRISVLDYSPQGWLLAGGVEATSSSDGASQDVIPLVLWHQESGEWVRPPAKSIDSGIVSLAFHPERDDIFATGLENGEVRLWRRHRAKGWTSSRTGSLEWLAVIAAHSQKVTGLAFRSDGRELISAANDGQLRRFSLRLRVEADPGDQVDDQSDDQVADEFDEGDGFDVIDLLVAPHDHPQLLSTLSQSASPSSLLASGASEEPSGSSDPSITSGLADSDAWSWTWINHWTLPAEDPAGQFCDNQVLQPLGQCWLKNQGAASLVERCDRYGVCRCDVSGDPKRLNVVFAGTLQKSSKGSRWHVFADHRSKLPLSEVEAEDLFKDLTKNKPEEGGTVLSAFAPLPKASKELVNLPEVARQHKGLKVIFRRVTLNDQPGYIEVLPRKEVRIEFDWKVEVANPASPKLDCPGCQVQMYYGLANPLIDERFDTGDKDPGFSKCLANAVMGPGYRGDSGSRIHSIQAPDRPGIYYVTWRFGMEYTCRPDANAHLPDFSQAIATIRVLGDYQPEDVTSVVVAPKDTLSPSEKVPPALNRLAIDPQGRRVAIASFDGRARVWSVDRSRTRSQRQEDSQPVMTEREGWGRLTDVAWHPDGDRFLTASVASNAVLWDTEGQKVATLKHGARVLAANFSPDGRKVVTASRDGQAYLWGMDGSIVGSRVESQDSIPLKGHGADVVSAVFSPDGEFILTASRDLTARLWNLQGEEIVSLSGHTGWLTGAIFSPQGRFVATASDDKKVRVWRSQDLVAGAENPLPWILGRHEDEVSAFAFSPDGLLLASASLDGKVKLWSTASAGRDLDALPVAVLEGHSDIVTDLAFSPNGRWIATASHDKTASVWKVEDTDHGSAKGQEPPLRSSTYRLKGHKHSVLAVRFLDNQRLVTTSFDGTAKLWDLEPGQEEEH